MKLIQPGEFRELRARMFMPMLSGLAVGWSMVHPAWAPLQWVAFFSWAWALRGATGVRGRLRAGFWFGSALVFLVLALTGVPAAAAWVLFGALSLYWMALGFLAGGFLRRGGVAGWAGAVSVLVLAEWAQVAVLPMFGTAQRFATAWVDYSPALLFSRLGGTTAVTVWVVAPAFALALWWTLPRVVRWAVPILLGAAAVWAPPAASAPQVLRVAVCGSAGGQCLDPLDFRRVYGEGVRRAAAEGATLVVTPELALYVTSSERDAVLAGFEDEAKRLGVTWVLGYSQYGPKANRAVVLNPSAGGRVSYDKTHWVPTIESYDIKGDGSAAVSRCRSQSGAWLKLGMMICQDDNFEDVARAVAAEDVDVVAVPTFDWKGVEFAHLNSARNRPREFGYVEARAAIGGVSAIIDAEGRVVASRNHFTEGDGPVVGTVRLSRGGPLGGRGSVWAVVAGMILSGCIFVRVRRPDCHPMGKS